MTEQVPNIAKDMSSQVAAHQSAQKSYSAAGPHPCPSTEDIAAHTSAMQSIGAFMSGK